MTEKTLSITLTEAELALSVAAMTFALVAAKDHGPDLRECRDRLLKIYKSNANPQMGS